MDPLGEPYPNYWGPYVKPNLCFTCEACDNDVQSLLHVQRLLKAPAGELKPCNLGA